MNWMMSFSFANPFSDAESTHGETSNFSLYIFQVVASLSTKALFILALPTLAQTLQAYSTIVVLWIWCAYYFCSYMPKIERSSRDGFSYFRSGGWINIWGGGAAACFGRGAVATPGKAKENV
jgi:hypothetical protein